jgi:hypothetical protein
MRTLAQRQNQSQKPIVFNSAVQRMLQAPVERPQTEPMAVPLAHFGYDFSQIPIHSFSAGRIQAKWAVNQLGDEHEREADRVAEKVTRMPEPRLQRTCTRGGDGKYKPAQQLSQEHFSLQTKRVQASDTGQIGLLPRVDEVLARPGKPLDPPVQAFFEPRFGQDFSHVQVHDDSLAAKSTEDLGALAYTVGNHIVFGFGHYQWASAQGRRLLAHELTHVLQQGRYAPRGLVQRKQMSSQPAAEVTVDPSATCNLDQHRKIEPAVYKANDWLSRAIAALDALLSGGKTKQAAEILNKHFHSTEPVVVTYIRDRLKTIQSDIFTRKNFRVNCPPASNMACGTKQGSEEFVAVVPSGNQNEVNLCAPFFERKEEDRASTIIHEFGHAQLGLSARQQIIDRGYQWDSYYAYMTTGEALTNAESYAMFAREIATGFSPAHAFIVDSLRNCPAAWVPIISDALSKARAWNHKAALNTKHTHQFSKAYKILDQQFSSGDSYKCIPDGGGRCTKRVVAYWYAAGDLRICPSLIGLRTPDERALALLGALYGYKDLVDGGDKQAAAAREAWRLHMANVPTTAEVLAGP